MTLAWFPPVNGWSSCVVLNFPVAHPHSIFLSHASSSAHQLALYCYGFSRMPVIPSDSFSCSCGACECLHHSRNKIQSKRDKGCFRQHQFQTIVVFIKKKSRLSHFFSGRTLFYFIYTTLGYLSTFHYFMSDKKYTISIYVFFFFFFFFTKHLKTSGDTGAYHSMSYNGTFRIGIQMSSRPLCRDVTLTEKRADVGQTTAYWQTTGAAVTDHSSFK